MSSPTSQKKCLGTSFSSVAFIDCKIQKKRFHCAYLGLKGRILCWRTLKKCVYVLTFFFTIKYTFVHLDNYSKKLFVVSLANR